MEVFPAPEAGDSVFQVEATYEIVAVAEAGGLVVVFVTGVVVPVSTVDVLVAFADAIVGEEGSVGLVAVVVEDIDTEAAVKDEVAC